MQHLLLAFELFDLSVHGHAILTFTSFFFCDLAILENDAEIVNDLVVESHMDPEGNLILF